MEGLRQERQAFKAAQETMHRQRLDTSCVEFERIKLKVDAQACKRALRDFYIAHGSFPSRRYQILSCTGTGDRQLLPNLHLYTPTQYEENQLVVERFAQRNPGWRAMYRDNECSQVEMTHEAFPEFKN